MIDIDINVKIKSGIKVRAFYLFFFIVAVQTGVGILFAPRLIFSYARQSSWLAILIAYAVMILVVFVMLYILKQYKNSDIFGIQVDIFGSFFGKALGMVYVLYFGGGLISTLSIYIEIIQVFIYPTIPAYVVSVLILITIIYTMLGGIRVIIGVSFLFFFLTQWLLFLLYDPIQSIDWDHLFPLLPVTIPDLLRGAKATSYTLAGFEMLFVIYPFIDNKEKVKLPMFSAISYSIFTLLLTMIITIGYYSPSSITNLQWPALTLFKSASYSFIERLDYLVVIEWFMVIIPTTIIRMWGVTYGLKRLFNIPQKNTLYITSIIVLVSVFIIQSNRYIDKISEIFGSISFWLIFVYPLVLLPLVYFKSKWRKKKGVS